MLLSTLFLQASSVENYEKKALELQLYDKAYWHILLHMDGNISEIDDENFFFAKDGKKNPQSELIETLEAFYTIGMSEGNSSICRFPARYAWLKEQLNADDFPTINCPTYQKILKKLDPISTTLVFPSAHINSPASMFGHTFLRINSSYRSRLLSYAVNYAASVDSETENGVIFALKGMTGGYVGHYSLLPYYEKLKEYKDSEQRDIWEYDLDLSKEETLRMFRHVWELNKTDSYYYFFTKNCSYNMLWLLESARPVLHLREKFYCHVIPLETVHVLQKAGIIQGMSYRASKRTILLKYEQLINEKFILYPSKIVHKELEIKKFLNDSTISLEQKRYILEATVEYLEYLFARGEVAKEEYMNFFHILTTQRAILGQGLVLNIQTPPNPIYSHRATKVDIGLGNNRGKFVSYFGFRPAYHSLEDSNYGFLRGTQIEFMNLLLFATREQINVEEATLLSIISLAQRSEFFKNFSWRMHLGWDSDSLIQSSQFNASVGAGYSWGNELAFFYTMVDPFLYVENGSRIAIGGSFGLNIDKYKSATLNLEGTQRIYETGVLQKLFKASINIRTTQNTQIVLKYDYKDKIIENSLTARERMRVIMKYYF